MVRFLPKNSCFHPQLKNSDEVVLSIEEVEAIRLSDFMGLDQDTAAESMGISRGTFQRIINEVRWKLADALVQGKIIRIKGGNYKMASRKICCKTEEIVREKCSNENCSCHR